MNDITQEKVERFSNGADCYIYKHFGSDDEINQYVDDYQKETGELLHVFRKIQHARQSPGWIWGEFGPGRPTSYTTYYWECGFTRYVIIK